MIDVQLKNKIIDTSRIEDVIPDLKPTSSTKRSYFCKCPFCGAYDEKKKKGLIVTPSKQLAKCFHCKESIKGAIDYLIKVEKKEYPDALHEMAQKYNILIPEARDKKNLKKRDFCTKQLKDSGLTHDDVKATIIVDEQTKKLEVSPFRSGTWDQYHRILVGQGDDMLIFYYDLHGKPVEYKKYKSEKFAHLCRARWQNPALHTDKEGRPKKYESPYGSGSHLYIPQKVRDLYEHKRKITRLFIQEGEKKAEKACKHGIISVGVMGIQNIGYNKQLPEDLQLIIQECDVKEIVFMIDADWNQLSDKIKSGDRVDMRPLSFYYAVKNYKEYMRTVRNLGVNIDTYFGYILPNERNDKGIDDILANTFRGKEKDFTTDIDFAMHDKEGKGQHVNIHKITVLDDEKLRDYWLLNDYKKFAEFHRAKLKDLAEFRIGKITYRFNEEEQVELAQPLMPNEQYWEEIHIEQNNGRSRTEYKFNYVRCFNFLQNRGFNRIIMKSGEFKTVHIENKIVQQVDHWFIRDFVTDFTKAIKEEEVLNMLYRGGPQYLGPEKLSNLEYTFPIFERADKTAQNMYFKSTYWEITTSGITENSQTKMTKYIWKDKVLDFEPELLKEPMIRVTRITEDIRVKLNNPDLINGEFLLDFSKDAPKCDFLQFLINTSKFSWKKVRNGEEISVEEHLEDARHLLNKLTAIGYMLHESKNDSELKMMIGADGRMSEVGASNGRSGKSLVGEYIRKLLPSVYIPGKTKDLTGDQFLFHEVTEKTRFIFIDDVRANIDFEYFFPNITGDFKVNQKGGLRFTLGKIDSPKMYMTTNHSINGDGPSFTDRQAFMVFCDFYNDKHKPVDDFGKHFFEEWSSDQWNLAYNLAATCLYLYFCSIEKGWSRPKQGIVEPPMESVIKRRLRQTMGEDFLTWADEFFNALTNDDIDIATLQINKRHVRRDLYNDFLDKCPHAKKWVTATRFGQKIKAYCQFRELHFNPGIPNEQFVEFTTWLKDKPGVSFIGGMDKSGSIEYFTIANEQYITEPF